MLMFLREGFRLPSPARHFLLVESGQRTHEKARLWWRAFSYLSLEFIPSDEFNNEGVEPNVSGVLPFYCLSWNAHRPTPTIARGKAL